LPGTQGFDGQENIARSEKLLAIDRDSVSFLLLLILLILRNLLILLILPALLILLALALLSLLIL
jgi:hypothetical protein